MVFFPKVWYNKHYEIIAEDFDPEGDRYDETDREKTLG